MYKILKAEKLADNIYLMDVEAPRVAKHCEPGQFVIVKMDEKGERIPLTICDYDREAGTITIVFQPIGASTNKFAKLQAGEYDAIITLGAVIEGATDHDQIVAQHASRKIADLALEYDTPVALGITGPGMTRMDAHRRVKNAKSAVEAAIKMCDRLNEI